MEDMELVIKISKEDFEIMKHNIAVNNPLCPLSQEEMVCKVANGIPLPERLGIKISSRLVDDVLDKIRTEIQSEIEEEKIDTERLYYDDLERAESYNTGIDNCIDIIQVIIDKYKVESEDKKGEQNDNFSM